MQDLYRSFMDVNNLIEKFAKYFPEMYQEMVSYTPIGNDCVYISLNDGRVVKFQLSKDGFQLTTS